MFQDGLAEEVRSLHRNAYGPDAPGLKAIGYKEFFVQDESGAARISEDLVEVERLIARNSRRYAKRQILYFSSLPNVIWIDTDLGMDHVIDEIKGKISTFHSPVLNF
jgi:tRNA dimethylallyltransferase